MNENTRIFVCCYEGDAHQINIEAMLRHGCPVTILSPDDSRAVIEHEGVDCRFGGKRAYIGQESLDRQMEHFKIMLTYPEEFFLVHDSDSVLLAAKIPQYLYNSPDTVWSNQVDDAIPEHQATFPEGWPHVAFQPPYFFSRQTVEKFVAVADDPRVKATPMMPFIDYYMVQLTMAAGLSWARVADSVSCPIAPDPRGTPARHHVETLTNGYIIAMDAVLNKGAIFAHSIKDPEVVKEFIEAHEHFIAGNPTQPERRVPPPRVGRGPIHASHRIGQGPGQGIPRLPIQRQGRARRAIVAGDPNLKA